MHISTYGKGRHDPDIVKGLLLNGTTVDERALDEGTFKANENLPSSWPWTQSIT